MGTQFQVDTEQISNSSADIARLASDIDSQVAAMMSRLTAMQSSWSGSASANFQETISSWQQVQQQVRESLQDISRVLGTAGSQYADAEAANAAMFRR